MQPVQICCSGIILILHYKIGVNPGSPFTGYPVKTSQTGAGKSSYRLSGSTLVFSFPPPRWSQSCFCRIWKLFMLINRGRELLVEQRVNFSHSQNWFPPLDLMGYDIRIFRNKQNLSMGTKHRHVSKQTNEQKDNQKTFKQKEKRKITRQSSIWHKNN